MSNLLEKLHPAIERMAHARFPTPVSPIDYQHLLERAAYRAGALAGFSYAVKMMEAFKAADEDLAGKDLTPELMRKSLTDVRIFITELEKLMLGEECLKN